MRLRTIVTITGLMLLFGIGLTTPATVQTAYAMGCEIPESGPWPPCATGGNSHDCVIPPSGPWPPCASSGDNGSNGNNCEIPESGPWPPCANDGGGNNQGGNGNGCVIPPSGPWPPCATDGNGQTPPPPPPPPAQGGVGAPSNTTQLVHQGRGAKQSNVTVAGFGSQITNIEVVVDFTFSENACAAGGSVERGVLGYALLSPSGTRVDLIDVAQLSGTQAGERAQMRFADGAPSPIHILSGRFAPADPLSWFDGENPNGSWTVIAFKNDWADAICQHRVTLHITAQ